MNKTTYEQELANRGHLIYTTVGGSMRPFLRSQRDLMRIEKREGRFSRFDVVLYRRKSGGYVLHRIIKVREGDYVLCGDNCWQKEPGIRDEQILGVLTHVIRDGKQVNVNERGYRLRVRLWWLLYWPRAAVLYLRDYVGAKWKRIKSKS